jgi:MFS family permease
MQLVRSLRHPPFALLWTGQTLSRLGDSLYRIALSWWVLKKTGSAAAMGNVLIFSLVPTLLFLLIGGVAADRLPRLRVLLVSDVLRAVLTGLIALLAFSDRLEVWHIYLASLLFGFVDAFFQPAYTAIVPQITPGELLTSANSLTSLSGQLAGIVGPALGAIIVRVAGEASAFALDGLSFLVSGACIVPLLGLALSDGEDGSSPGMIHDLRQGIGTVLASPWLWITIAMASVGNIFLSGPLGVSLPFLVSDSLHMDVDALGLIYSLTSIGSVIGAVWLGRARKLHRRGLLVYGGWIIGSLGVAATGLPITLIGVLIASLVFGLAITVVNLVWMNTLQELVPSNLLGRVSSVDQLGSAVFVPFGYALAGWATDLMGAPLVFMLGGVLGAALAVPGLMHPAIRNLD